MYLIPSSPLTKIFLPEWRDKLVEKPELISDGELEFTFNIPFGTGAIGPFTLNKLTRLDDLPCVRHRDPIDRPALYEVLTGGKNGDEFRETDAYGLAAVEIPHDVTSLNMKIVDLRIAAEASKDPKAIKKAKDEEDEIQKSIRDTMIESRKRAREIADRRVMHMVKETYLRLKDQWQKSRERNEGQHIAASAELCCMWVLNDLIKDSSEKRRKMNDQVAELIKNIQSAV